MAIFFHSDDVDSLIPLKEAVVIAENALKDIPSPKGVNAPRKRLNLHRNLGENPFDTVLNVYAGGSASYGGIGAQVALHRKAISGSVQKRPPYNPDQTELALIYDTDSGSLLGIMAHRPRHVQGAADLRTPATSLVGLDLFARRDAKRVGIYGSGHQAYSTFLGLTEFRKIESAKVYSPTPAHRESFASKMSEVTGVPVRPVDAPRSAAEGVDIILCMTNTNVPVIDGSWLEEGQYIISVVGSNIELVKSGNIPAPRREIDDETLRRCSMLVALSRKQAIDSQQGDIYWPVQEGVITWDKVVDIADILAGKARGRTDDKQIILYKNQGGQGIIDIALAKKCYDLARQHGKGYELDIRARSNWWVQGGRQETW
ncbi:MAG: ornithine cyclodeaminase family protein [Candidatus Binatia bacterium]|jgi:ornithine cyclodeaminase/alanine dehydrogenase-like protein (mu-crystallin family)|nr:ornithine cyclodeaminase family protein [Candidatus Binatia bacterium]